MFPVFDKITIILIFFSACCFQFDAEAKSWFAVKERSSHKRQPVEARPVHIPSWIRERVEAELAPFKQQGVTSGMLDEIWKGSEDLLFIRIAYKNGERVACYSDNGKQDFLRFSAVKEVFEKLNRESPLPDFDLIVTLHDEYCGALPLLTFAKNKHSLGGILIPDFEALQGYKRLTANILAANRQYPWSVKENKAFWRGASTGGTFQMDNWDKFPRARLVMHSINNPRDIDARFTSLVQMDRNTHNYLSAKGFLGMPAAAAEHVRYKYQIEVDGNSCSYSRCYWELLSNSVMLKQVSDNIQWYYGALVPYQHYIPLATDLSDLLQQIFWAKAHDGECKQIAENATLFAKKELSVERTHLYLRVLLEEYAKSVFRG